MILVWTVNDNNAIRDFVVSVVIKSNYFSKNI